MRGGNVGAFGDVRIVLDKAMTAGGAVYHADNYAHAVKWRARAYTLRKILYQLSQEEVKAYPGVLPSTPYDEMVLKLLPDDNKVTIEIRKPSGKLFALDGRELDIEPLKAEDALRAAAARLKEELEF